MHVILWIILLLIACIHTTSVAFDFLFPGRNYAATTLGQLHHKLNNKVHLDAVSDGLLLVLSIYACVRVLYERRIDTLTKFVIILTVVLFHLVVLFPLVNAWNLVLMMFVRNEPFIDEKQRYFPNHTLFEAQFRAVKDDVYRLLAMNKLLCANQVVPNVVAAQHGNNKCWKWQMLKMSGHMVGLQKDYPTLYSLLSQSNQVHNAFISVLEGHSEIPPHVGYFKGYLRYHLGITIPEENGKRAFINVKGQRYEWKEGHGVMFDDMYYHYVVNPTSKTRIVLFLDVIRNDVPYLLRPLNHVVFWLFNNHPVIQHVYNQQHSKVAQS